MELGHIKLALNDLQLAQKEGLPQQHKAELYARLAECYHALGETKRAKVSADLAKKLGVKKITVHILKRIKAKDDATLPNLTRGSNKDFMDLSALIRIKQNQEMGRYAIAEQDIQTGDVLAVEQPYVACLLPECFGSHCHHCFKRWVISFIRFVS